MREWGQLHGYVTVQSHRALHLEGPHSWFNTLQLPSWNFFLKIFFLMWTIFKVIIEFVTILLLFYVLVFWPWGMWDLSSPTRDQTHTPCIGKRSLNHWTAREVPALLKFLIIFKQGTPFFLFFLAALGLRCCAQAFSSCGERGLFFIVVHGLFIAVASLVAVHGL